jgi:hypothetical protein
MSGGVAGVLLTGSALKGSLMAKGTALQEKLQSKSRYTNAFIISQNTHTHTHTHTHTILYI